MRGLGQRVENHLPRGTWPAQNVKRGVARSGDGWPQNRAQTGALPAPWGGRRVRGWRCVQRQASPLAQSHGTAMVTVGMVCTGCMGRRREGTVQVGRLIQRMGSMTVTVRPGRKGLWRLSKRMAMAVLHGLRLRMRCRPRGMYRGCWRMRWESR